MQVPGIPHNELDRLNALRHTGLLDSPPEERFDRLTRLTKHIFKTRIVVISLIDADRQWFKSRQGLDVCETSRKVSFCGHAILEPEILEIEDASKDERFFDNPLVTGEPYIRFYAGVPIKSACGNVLGTLCIIDDKPRRLTDDERLCLRELADCVEAELTTIDRRHLLSVATQTTNGVVITNLAGRIVWANSGFTRLTGYSLDEVRGQTPISILKGDASNHAAISQMQAALVNCQPFDVEIVNYDRSGQPHWVHISGNPLLNERGQPEGYLSIQSDLTKIMQAEQLKRELTTTISHELRTPLTSIDGAISLLKVGAAGVLPESARKLVDIADRNTKRLRVLIDDLLDMEKLLAGKLSFCFRDLELRSLLEQALSEHQPFADLHGVRVRLDASINQTRIYTDPDRFQQVMNNLLSNAVKFSPANAEVVVTTHEDKQFVRVTVRDQGPGIAPEFQPQVFEKFAQADSSDTRKRGGTGLGLAITKELVEQMHGHIGFDSAPGEGATFWFELPRQSTASNHH
ncbi:MAG: ATP-binding protein [Pseudohongiella sp.]|nr:ATP-binding protein [Pseudohongiella sp.]